MISIRHVIEGLALPLPIVQLILLFAAEENDYDTPYRVSMYPYLPTFPVEQFEQFRQVSPRWAETIDQLHTEHTRRVLVFAFKTGDDNERQAFAQALSRRGNDLRALVLVSGEYHGFMGWNYKLFSGLCDVEALDAIPFDWDALLQCCPRLERLDISFLPLSSQHVVRIINAAAAHCLDLQALLLPKREVSSSVPSWEITEPIMDALYPASQRWYEQGSRGGLRQLSWPERPYTTDAEYLMDRTDEIFEWLGAFAPEIEYIDGWLTSYSEDPSFYTNELLFGGLEAWTYFCENASNLAELNWFVLPFVDSFFQAFGRSKQTNLKVLTLAAGEHYNFPDFMTNGSYFSDGPWTFSSEGLRAVPRACPALHELRIIFQKDDDELEARQDAFDDAFLESVATNCVELRTLYLVEYWTGQDVLPMRNITDNGIIALSKLPELKRVSLKATQCTSRGVMALLLNSPVHGPARIVDISFSPERNGPRFHEVVLQLENWHSLFKADRTDILERLRELSDALMRADSAFAVTNGSDEDCSARLTELSNEELSALETVCIRFVNWNMTQWMELPTPLWRVILAMAAPDYRGESLPEMPSLPRALMHTLVASSPAWISILQPLVQAHDTAVLRFGVDSASVKEIQALQRSLEQRNGALRCLALTLRSAAMAWRDQALTATSWEAVFEACPRLERLEITGIVATSGLFAAIIEAAALKCPSLQALALSENVVDVPSDTRRRHIVQPIRAALKSWQATRTLRQLRIPSKMLATTEDDDSASDVFMRGVLECAPGVEYLDAWKAGLKAFGQCAKPLLESMTFAGIERPSLLIDGTDVESLTEYSVQGVEAALSACASLKCLRVVFDMGMSASVSVPRQRHWGDAFLRAVARSCVSLREFAIVELNGGVNNIPIPLETITDEGIMALAELPELRDVALKASRCTARGLHALLALSPTSGRPRQIKMDVGCLFVEGFVEDDDDEPEVVTFYDVIVGLLQRLYEDYTGQGKTTRRSGIVNLIASLFSRRGFFGVEGDHFEEILAVREIVESVLQAYQAYRMSQLLARPWLNRFYVAMLVVNCWMVPIVHLVYRNNTMLRRALSLLCDALLDFTSAMVVPTVLLFSYYAQFDTVSWGFPYLQWYDDVWFVNVATEFQIMLVSSWGDLVSRCVFSLGLISCIENAKELLGQDPSYTSRTTNGVKHHTVPQLSKRPEVKPATGPRGSTARLRVMSSFRQLRSRSLRRVLQTLQILCVLLGAVVVVLHLHAESASRIDQCLVQVHPWLERKPACVLLQWDCETKRHSGEATAITTQWGKSTPAYPRRILILHCPQLEMPTLTASFHELATFKMYNSTITHWSEDAAFTATNHPNMVLSYFIRVNLSNTGELPPGLTTAPFPPTLWDIEFVHSNLKKLPDDLDTKWPLFMYFVCEVCEFTAVPPVLTRMMPYWITFGANPFPSFPFDVFGIAGLTHFGFASSGLPSLAAANDSFLDDTTVRHLYLAGSNVTWLPRWLDRFAALPRALWYQPAVDLTYAPVCDAITQMQAGTLDRFPAAWTAGVPAEQLSIFMHVVKENVSALDGVVGCFTPTLLGYPLDEEDARYMLPSAA
ncbi:hypothetical protein P43SY_005742 [Pythium insidiosum]|uniref:Uncharacterized protein n=1 Tax=Pythium insidiosum TaxID=114742 RepID=A0AAD5LUD0_PYTIN|nr:hypothetical protein P43SY_005742 [Pythium insidiosum]